MLNAHIKKFFSLRQLLIIVSSLLILTSCSFQKQISKSARQLVLSDSSLLTAHIGISIYEPATGKYWYNYQGDKYFVPASNTKIPTCYVAMKYLGDSLVGLRVTEYENHIFLFGNGDPTFLHGDFKNHPIYNFLRTLNQSTKSIFFGSGGLWQETGLGSGWSWNDYDADYMAERSQFPIYGNVVSFSGKAGDIKVTPNYFNSHIEQYSTPKSMLSRVERKQFNNDFKTFSYGNSIRTIQVPFITSDTLSFKLLIDTLKINKWVAPGLAPPIMSDAEKIIRKYVLHSQPTDSLLKPMMHRSDNFFAEQSLLMVSNELLGVMNDAKIIDTLLKTDFKDLPQKPRWVDGSGLSRYNLFTPQDFVAILNKMKNEFGMERIKVILPTGGEGTISSYYKADSNYIFVKTGTLSGVVALSGFLYTKKGKLLIFSTLVNNHQASATAVRRAVEKFLQGIRQNF
jgi:D-alanyl-D-alanine carboxypeptidase/D-alanyl-D-alanine-endopeptidase (penicillin-binding protein 4)